MNSNSMHSHSTPVGLIGLGLLGAAIAERLRAAGFPLIGFDVDVSRAEPLRTHGVEWAESAVAVFARCGRVVLSLPTQREVGEVIDGAATALRDGQCVIDTTTGEPASSEAVAARLASRGVRYLDATISGSSAQVRQGTAALMVGGAAESFADCSDVFHAIGARVFHTGPAGSGARTKLVTNLVLGLNRAALAEGLVLAEALGLDLALTLEVMRGSAAYSKIMDSKGERMLRREYRPPDARLAQHLKDVRLILEAGQAAGLSMPLSETHKAILEAAAAAGWGDADNSALIEALRPAVPTKARE